MKMFLWRSPVQNTSDWLLSLVLFYARTVWAQMSTVLTVTLCLNLAYIVYREFRRTQNAQERDIQPKQNHVEVHTNIVQTEPPASTTLYAAAMAPSPIPPLPLYTLHHVHSSANALQPPRKFNKHTNIEKWLRELEAYMAATYVPSKLRTLLALLEADCLRLLDHTRLSASDEEAYNGATSFLKLVFGKAPRNRPDYANEFFTRQQRGDENVTLFFAELNSLANEAFSDMTPHATKEYIAHQFVRGLL